MSCSIYNWAQVFSFFSPLSPLPSESSLHFHYHLLHCLSNPPPHSFTLLQSLPLLFAFFTNIKNLYKSITARAIARAQSTAKLSLVAAPGWVSDLCHMNAMLVMLALKPSEHPCIPQTLAVEVTWRITIATHPLASTGFNRGLWVPTEQFVFCKRQSKVQGASFLGDLPHPGCQKCARVLPWYYYTPDKHLLLINSTTSFALDASGISGIKKGREVSYVNVCPIGKHSTHPVRSYTRHAFHFGSLGSATCQHFEYSTFLAVLYYNSIL